MNANAFIIRELKYHRPGGRKDDRNFPFYWYFQKVEVLSLIFNYLWPLKLFFNIRARKVGNAMFNISVNNLELKLSWRHCFW